MRVNRQGIWLGTLALMAFASSGHAQSTVTPEDEYKKQIRISDDIQPLGEHPFGERISLYTGELSFEQADIDWQGTGLPIQLIRTFAPRDEWFPLSAFGDWELSIPRITTLSANQQNVKGWVVRKPGGATSAVSTARCTNFGPPPVVLPPLYDASMSPWSPAEWWNGYQLVVPGQGSQDLLRRSSENNLSPHMGSVVFPIVTKQHWMITCLPQTTNGVAGEAFLAVAPDGTRYWFDRLVYGFAPELTRPQWSGGGPMGFQAPRGVRPMATAGDDGITRYQASMLVTRVEDRFGNSLVYTYNGSRLASIEASDGRRLTLVYGADNVRVHSVTMQSADTATRTWVYQYDSPLGRLVAAVLPDQSRWTYALGGLGMLKLSDHYVPGDCSSFASTGPGFVPELTGTITHPSGLVGSFQLGYQIRGRSYVPKDCWMSATGGGPQTGYTLTAVSWPVISLYSKTFSGAGVPSQGWQYRYSPSNASWLGSCAATCPETVWTDVAGPDSKATRYTFSNRYDATETLLLRTDYFDGPAGSTLSRSEVNSYASASGNSWPAHLGNNLGSQANYEQVSQLLPLNQRVAQQDGDTYTWQASGFDEYGQVTQTRRFNSIAGQRMIEEKTNYLNDLPHWVLGLPTQTTNVTSSEVVNQYVYDLAQVTLKERWRFGQKLMSYTFNSAGQLASFTDGNAHTTTLGNYKRGIPQTIGYPDSTSESLAVDDFGQISAITDQAGHTTSYAYDAVGRITQVTYPSGDEVAWYPTGFNYAFVTSAERGIAANHWRRTVTTGNASTVTYFDAMLRPLLSDTSIIGTAGSNTSSANAYDFKGRATFTSYPVAGAPALSAITNGTHHTYDALGRSTQSIQDSELGALTSLTSYLSGARRQFTDPKGNVTTTSYQVFDEPGGDAVIQVQAPQGITQTIVRDIYGNPQSITQSGLYGTEQGSITKNLYYDIYHRLCRSSEPESGSTVLHYDAANNLDWSATGLAISGSACSQDQAPAASQTARSYDAMNRVLTISPPTGTQGTVTTYDALGQVKTTTSGIAVQSYNYNFRGMLTSEALSMAGTAYAWGLGYSHDAYGHVSAIGYPGSVSEGVAYAPDALGRATQAGSYASGVHYFPDGSEQSYMLGNGISALIQQNTRLLPSGLSYALGGTQRLNEAYVYDKDANLTSLNDLVNGQNNQTLGYDGLNRLTAASAPNAWGTQSYAYDALNNLRQNISGSSTINLNVDGNNRLTSAALGTVVFTTYQNDARGNRSAMTYGGVTTQYSFDANNQLLAVPGVASYAYDAAGRRVVKTPAVGGAAAATYSFYSQAGQLLFGYDAASGLGTNYIYLNGKLIARHKGSAVTYLLTDRLGSPVREADTSGNVTASFSYRPYGDLYSGPNQGQPGFTGHVNDPETAFIYMQARYYDAAVGRFLSADPASPTVGNLFNFNRYDYANNNPINHTDPDGRYSCTQKDLCSSFEKGMVLARGAAQSSLLSPDERADLKQVTDFIGTPADGKKVTINFSTGTDAMKGGTETYNSKTGVTTLTLRPDNNIINLGKNSVHEGKHGITDSSRGRTDNTRAERKQNEVGAYTTQAYYQKAMRYAAQSSDPWTPAGISAENIENSAELSVRAACGNSTEGNCGN